MQELEFKLKPSIYYRFILVVIFIFSELIILAISLPLAIRLMGCLFLLLYFCYLYWYEGLLKGKRAVSSIQLTRANKWLLQTAEGLHESDLCGDTLLTFFVSIMRFKLNNQSKILTAIVFKDSLRIHKYRQLITMIKTHQS